MSNQYKEGKNGPKHSLTLVLTLVRNVCDKYFAASKVWRYFTYSLVHAGLRHITANTVMMILVSTKVTKKPN